VGTIPRKFRLVVGFKQLSDRQATRLTQAPQITGKFCVQAVTSVTEVFFLSLPSVLVTPMWRAKSHIVFHAMYHHGQRDTTTSTFIHKFTTSSFGTCGSARLVATHSHLSLARQSKSHPTAHHTNSLSPLDPGATGNTTFEIAFSFMTKK